MANKIFGSTDFAVAGAADPADTYLVEQPGGTRYEQRGVGAQWTLGQAGAVPLDSFPGADDDTKLTLALAYAAAQTYSPAITLPPRLCSFSTKGRPFFRGLIVAGPGTKLNSAAPGTTLTRTHEVALTFDSKSDGIGWFHQAAGDPTVRQCAFMGLAFRDSRASASGHPAFLTQDAAGVGFQQLHVRDITASGLWGVLGVAAQRLLLTACTIDGNWDLNNGWNTAIYVGGSDSQLWDTGQLLMDSPGSPDGAGHEPAGNGTPHIRIGFLDKSVIGRIYCTATGNWYALLVEGQGYNSGSSGGNSGPVLFRGLVAEGRNKGTPCNGALVRVLGGQPVFQAPWIGYGMADPATDGHGAQGLIQCEGGYTRIYAPTYGDATGVSQTAMPLVYATGAGTRVRMRDGGVGSQNGAWGDPRPRAKAATGGNTPAMFSTDDSFVVL